MNRKPDKGPISGTHTTRQREKKERTIRLERGGGATWTCFQRRRTGGRAQEKALGIVQHRGKCKPKPRGDAAHAPPSGCSPNRQGRRVPGVVPARAFGLAAAGPAWSERCMRRPRTGRLAEPPQKAAGLSPVTRQNQGRAVRRDLSQGGSRGARLRAAVT